MFTIKSIVYRIKKYILLNFKWFNDLIRNPNYDVQSLVSH